MKILIAGKYSPIGRYVRGGLQSWIQTVFDELIRLNHEVSIYDSTLSGISCVERDKYDLGIFSNIKYTKKLVKCCKNSVLVSHGIIKDEKPENDCDKLFYVSENVRDYWKLPGEIIRQPIDLSYWVPDNQEKINISRYSYRTGIFYGNQAAKEINKPFVHINGVTHNQAKNQINRSILVFATGRAALEAMSCNIPVVFYDHRETYQGPLIDISLNRQIKNSYSGRGGYQPKLEDVIEEMMIVLSQGGKRTWIEKHHDSKIIVKQLLSHLQAQGQKQ